MAAPMWEAPTLSSNQSACLSSLEALAKCPIETAAAEVDTRAGVGLGLGLGLGCALTLDRSWGCVCAYELVPRLELGLCLSTHALARAQAPRMYGMAWQQHGVLCADAGSVPQGRGCGWVSGLRPCSGGVCVTAYMLLAMRCGAVLRPVPRTYPLS